MALLACDDLQTCDIFFRPIKSAEAQFANSFGRRYPRVMKWIVSAALFLLFVPAACTSDDPSETGSSGGGSGAGTTTSNGGAGGVSGPCDAPDGCLLDECRYVPEHDGACVNEGDLTIIQHLNYDLEWNNCVPSCMVDVDCNTTCFVTNTGMSEPCSRCFSEMVSCWILSCASSCPNGGGTPECFACVEQNCFADYEPCFGTLKCPYEFACGDHFDNDDNGLVDGEDPACQ
jgi:hypothetical protein